MGHSINAVLIREKFDRHSAANHRLKCLPLNLGVTLLPLYAELVDYWADRYKVYGFLSPRPLLNANVVHRVMREVVGDERFAIVETNYFGGIGDQAAAVYSGSSTLMHPESGRRGPINKALRHLSVRRLLLIDAFERVGLSRYRHLYDYIPEDLLD